MLALCFNIFNLNNAFGYPNRKGGRRYSPISPFPQRSLRYIYSHKKKVSSNENMAVGGVSIHFLDSTVTERIIIAEYLRILQICSQGMISGRQLI